MKVNCTTEETISPVSFVPPLWTGNGFGYTLYGGDEQFFDERTGIDYSIKTCYFCFFWIPLYPIARYAVALTGYNRWGHSTHGGSTSTYSFAGQLPLNTTNYIHYIVSVIIIGFIMNASNPRLHSDIQDIMWSFGFSLWFQVFARVPFLIKFLMFVVLYYMVQGYYTLKF